jgi:hypothetical protein
MPYIKNIIISILLLTSIYLSFRSINTLESINARIDRDDVEYQFVVTDSTITVWDDNRFVGTVKLQGELDSLIIADNE